jgi:hypothetical protein
MTTRGLRREEAFRFYDLIGGLDIQPVGWAGRIRRRVENLSPALGLGMVVGVGLGLYGGALAGVSIGLAGDGSLLFVLLGIPLLTVCCAVGAHLTPRPISEPLE